MIFWSESFQIKSQIRIVSECVFGRIAQLPLMPGEIWRFQMVTDCWEAFLGEPFHSIFLVEIDRNSQGCPANENKFQKLFFIKYLPINLGVILFTPLVKTVKIIQKQTMGVLEQQRRHH